MFGFFGKKNAKNNEFKPAPIGGSDLMSVISLFMIYHRQIERAVIKQAVIPDEADLVNHLESGDCPIGTWIKTTGQANYGSDPVFQELVEAHAKYRAVMVDCMDRRSEMTSRDRLMLISPAQQNDFRVLPIRIMSLLSHLEVTNHLKQAGEKNHDHHPETHIRRVHECALQ